MRGLATLHNQADFQRVFDVARRFFRDGVGFYFRKGDNPEFRFGIIASRRFGQAVDRNRFRRRVREILRLHPRIPRGVEVIINVYKPCAELTFPLLRQTISWALDRIRRNVAHE